MKRAMTLLLALVMILSLAACGKPAEQPQPQAPAEPQVFRVGFGKASIQPPDLNIVLSGGGDPNRYVESVLDIIAVTCIAVTDATGKTVLFYTNDIQHASESWTKPCREFISEKFDIPYEQIFVASTHVHSVPALNRSTEANRKFCDTYEAGLIKSTEDALADRAEAEIYVGTADGHTPDGKPLNYVRLYEMNDGSFAGDNFGIWTSGIKGHAYEGDTDAQLVKFVRPSKEKDVLMVSFPTHATFHGTSTLRNLSADYPGPTRDYIDANSNCLTAIFAGAGGDQEPETEISAENHRLDYREFGATLGQAIIDAFPDMQKLENGDIKMIHQEFTRPANKFTDQEVLDKARDVYNYFLENGQTKGIEYAKQFGFYSPYQARAYIWRSNLGETKSMTIAALSMGELSIAIAPYEMFSQSGKAVMAGSPFEKTIVLGYCNGTADYIPTEVAYEFNGGVGSYEAYATGWPKGTAEELVTEYVNMLTELKG